jgi:hypothetical protein
MLFCRMSRPRQLILLLLLISGLHPNPGPSRPQSESNFNILQININGLQNSVAELSVFLVKHSIKVACIQETKLSARSKTSTFPGFALIRKDRPAGRGGGLIILIHDSISFHNIDVTQFGQQDQSTEILAICADVGGVQLDIFNIYMPPASALANFNPDFSALFDLPNNDSLFFGDFNAHHSDWCASLDDNRGASLVAAIDNVDLCILNSDSPTRIPSAANQSPSSPDVSIASAHLVPSLTWETLTTLNSDHLPIKVSYQTGGCPPRLQRTFTNFHKADWSGFIRESELLISSEPLPTSVAKGEKVFRRVLLTAAKHNIPSGYRKDYIPSIPTAAKHLINQRDEVRRRNPKDPDVARLNGEISEVVRVSKRLRWSEKLDSSSYKQNPNKFWSLLRSLSGKTSRPPKNQPISFNGKARTSPSSISRCFCKQYTSVGTHKSNPRTRKVIRTMRKQHEIDDTLESFNITMVQAAISASKSSVAVGPDGLTSIHFKHLGARCLAFLTKLFNLSTSLIEIPVVWKTAIIIPILKPGKPADQGTSYRPISLLSPAVKILERLLRPHIRMALLKHPSQHGYSEQHSTVTALLPIATKVAIGFNAKKPASRSVLVTIDVSKAFDSVDHTLLIEQISGSSLPSNYVRWLAAYLRGRVASCQYGGVVSKPRNIKSGTPQGSGLSPDLYNYFTSDCPVISDVHDSFADDIDQMESGPDLDQICTKLNLDLSATVSWSKEKNLVLAPSKSQVTLFTPDTKQVNVHPQIFIDGTLVPLCRNLRYLGSDFDTMFCFNGQSVSNQKKFSKGVALLRAVGGTNWGFDKETLLRTFNVIIKPAYSFNAPIWVPNTKPSHIQKLQLLQNRAMRVITGCHQATAIDHLHQETSLLPVGPRLDMLCTQFLASAMRRDHPSHATVMLPPGPRTRKNKDGEVRPLKETLFSRYGHELTPYLNDDGIIAEVSYNRTREAIHTKAVERAIRAQGPNRLLGHRPPIVADSERSLPRAFQTTLNQLRSDFCSALKSYQFFINRAIDDICPECQGASQTVSHIFSCPSFPTNLRPIDIWRNPVSVANFIGTLPAFDYLPPLVPVPPPPPPEPPP